ncbi:MAG: DegT/DnrJ/EryC1/StrS family aminotransferase [Candidatus Zixiibacteriota bacterium]
MKVPFFRLKISDEEIDEVNQVLRAGWVTTGPKVKELEQLIVAYTGAKYACAVSSATAGLHLVLEALDLSFDNEIITTPYTMAATIESIIYTGAKPVLVDIDPGTLNINPAKIAEAVSSDTRAIMAVDIAGFPADYDTIRKIADRHNLTILSDAAHSLGALQRGKKVGTLADATVFSFYSTKNITTGEGGMVVSDNKGLIDKIRHLSLHGMTSSGWKRNQGGSWEYDITELGFKYNMSDINAALGVGRMKRFESLQKRRKEIARYYIEHLNDLSEYLELPDTDKIDHHAWHLFIIKLKLENLKIDRNQFIDELDKAGVGCSVHFMPIYHFSYFELIFDYSPDDFPYCEDSFSRVVSLPMYPDLTDEEVDYVCRMVQNIVHRSI